MRQKIGLCLLLIVSAAGCAQDCKSLDGAQCVQLGMAYWGQGDSPHFQVSKNLRQGLAIMEQACRKGSALACNRAADAYFWGIGTKSDWGASTRYRRLACQHGTAEDCARIAALHLHKNPYLKDTYQPEAYDFFSAVCARGACGDVQFEFYSDLAPNSPALAAEFLSRACEKGHGASCFVLSEQYLRQAGLPWDEQRALKLVKRACDLHFQPACTVKVNADTSVFGIGYDEGSGHLPSLAKNSPEEAKFEAACRKGSGDACFALGLAINRAPPETKDPCHSRNPVTKALKMFDLACDQNLGPACNDEGRMDLFGIGTHVSEHKAMRLFSRACELKDATGCRNRDLLAAKWAAHHPGECD